VFDKNVSFPHVPSRGKDGLAKVSDFGLAKNFQIAGLSGMSLTGQYAVTT
jgi:hypothetical protein